MKAVKKSGGWPWTSRKEDLDKRMAEMLAWLPGMLESGELSEVEYKQWMFKVGSLKGSLEGTTACSPGGYSPGGCQNQEDFDGYTDLLDAWTEGIGYKEPTFEEANELPDSFLGGTPIKTDNDMKDTDPKVLIDRINQMMNRVREGMEAGDIPPEQFNSLISDLSNDKRTLAQGCSGASCDRVEDNLNEFEAANFPQPKINYGLTPPSEELPVTEQETSPMKVVKEPLTNPMKVVKEDPVRPVRVVKEDPVAAPPKREVPQPKGRQPEVQYESNPNMKTGQSPLNMKVWDAKRKQWTTTPLEGGYRERYIQENRIQS